MDSDDRTQMFPTEILRCKMCDRPIVAKPRAGKPKLYCSPACKEAGQRQNRGARLEPRKDGRSLGNVQVRKDGVPICALEGCENPAAEGKRGKWRMYCSNAHKQKAKRVRVAEATRRQFGPSVERTRPFPTEPLEPPMRRPTQRKAKRPEDDLLYWRKGRGVTHMGVSSIVTFCGRGTEGMTKRSGPGITKLCQRCQDTRDNKTWWHGYRAALGDADYED